jgi:hypothetical protein
MGCTVVACFVQDNVAHVAHVGDSRLYLIREGRISWVTRDHTRIRFLVEAGLLSEADAEDHPEGNVITRAVGHDPADIDGGFVVDVRNTPIQILEGDSLLLCSDGLYDMVPDREILSILAGRTARAGVDFLVDRANELDRFGNEPGGYDNITVAILHFGQDCGSTAALVDEDTLEPQIDTAASGGAVPTASIHGQDPTPAYQPRRSTLVPESTIEDATVTLPDEGITSSEPGVGTGTVELKVPRKTSLGKTAPTPTIEVQRLRRNNIVLLAAVAVLVITLALIGIWLMTQRSSPSGAGPGPASPTPGVVGDDDDSFAPGLTADDDDSSAPGGVAADDDDSSASGSVADDDDSSAIGKASGGLE